MKKFEVPEMELETVKLDVICTSPGAPIPNGSYSGDNSGDIFSDDSFWTP